MHDDLTVKETLLMYSGLRLPSTLSRAERIAVVADVMAVLEIRDIAHEVIGSVETRGIR
jgi:ABC-type multidrug transport system ATPase subunit